MTTIPCLNGPIDGLHLPALGNEAEGDKRVHSAIGGDIRHLYIFDGRCWRFARSWREAREIDCGGPDYAAMGDTP